MRPTIWPTSTRRSTALTAARPPKERETLISSRSTASPRARTAPPRARVGPPTPAAALQCSVETSRQPSRDRSDSVGRKPYPPSCTRQPCLALAERFGGVLDRTADLVLRPDGHLLATLPLLVDRDHVARAVGVERNWPDHRRSHAGRGDGAAQAIAVEALGPAERIGEHLDHRVGRAYDAFGWLVVRRLILLDHVGVAREFQVGAPARCTDGEVTIFTKRRRPRP